MKAWLLSGLHYCCYHQEYRAAARAGAGRLRSNSEVSLLERHVRSSPDCVAKLENRTNVKISRKLILRPLRCCVDCQCHYGDPWSILDQSVWSLTSPPARRISGSKNFCSTPQKEFCNTIAPTADIVGPPRHVRVGPTGDMVALAPECHRLNVRSGEHSLIAIANPQFSEKPRRIT